MGSIFSDAAWSLEMATNDAPALHEADIGLSMGIYGTQVAKESSYIIIVDGSFASVVKADIGLSMGIQGTEVAKESSYIIILDNSFASVVKVVLWGRSVYANIQKLIQFQLTVNVAALVINVVAAISLGDVSLITVQPLVENIMWRNLIIQIRNSSFEEISASTVLLLFLDLINT